MIYGKKEIKLWVKNMRDDIYKLNIGAEFKILDNFNSTVYLLNPINLKISGDCITKLFF